MVAIDYWLVADDTKCDGFRWWKQHSNLSYDKSISYLYGNYIINWVWWFYFYNLFTKKEKIALLKLNLIGISVQFSWEFALLINGIRPLNQNSFTTIVINSLIETNLGMPYIYLIFIWIYRHFKEDLRKVEIQNASHE